MTAHFPMRAQPLEPASVSAPGRTATALDRTAYLVLCVFVFSIPWAENVPVWGRSLAIAILGMVAIRTIVTGRVRKLSPLHYAMLALVACISMLRRASLFPLDGRRIADVGCGDGTWLLEFVQWGADPTALCGIDLSAGRIERARHRLPHADIRVGEASQLPWPDESFDVVSQFTVFTSILDPELKRAVASEMLRVLKPGGVILWFDFRVNNPSNAQVRGVSAREIRLLFEGCEVQLAPVLLAPPLGRADRGMVVAPGGTLALFAAAAHTLRRPDPKEHR